MVEDESWITSEKATAIEKIEENNTRRLRKDDEKEEKGEED